MLYFVIIVAAIFFSLFIWAAIDYKKQKKERNKKGEKAPFRTEDDLQEYGKPMKDEEHATVDFDDAE